MDEIEKLREDIKNCREVWFSQGRRGEEPVQFSGFLDEVADIFEREGLGITYTFLADKSNHSDWKVRAQAASVTRVLQFLSKSPQVESRRAIGRLIIKSLRTLSPHRSERR